MLKTDTIESTENYRFAISDVFCDISQGVIETGGKFVQLEPRLRGVFALLVQRGQAIVTRDEFLETVWDNDGSDEALTQAISRLRKILGDNTLIETVPRTGYRLAVLPHKSEANEPLRSRPSKAVLFQSQNLTAINLGILLIMVGAAAFWLGTHSSGADDTQIELEIEKGPDSEFYKIPDQPS